jgi:hypothetical protein
MGLGLLVGKVVGVSLAILSKLTMKECKSSCLIWLDAGQMKFSFLFVDMVCLLLSIISASC